MSRLWALALLATSTGCALVINRGNRQELWVESDPPGAVATLDGASCSTPCSLPAPRSRDAVVTLTREDRDTTSARFRSRLGSATLANVLLWLPGLAVGIPTDLLSGAAYELVPSGARIPMAPIRAGGDGSDGTASPVAPIQLAPRSPSRISLSVNLGVGGANVGGEDGILHAGVVGTGRLSGPFVLGAAADHGTVFELFSSDEGTVTSLAAVAGVDATPTRNSRAVLLLHAGTHRYSDRWVDLTFPAVGVRGELAAIFSDVLAVGIYGAFWKDLEHRTLSATPYSAWEYGGSTLLFGFSLGFVGR